MSLRNPAFLVVMAGALSAAIILPASPPEYTDAGGINGEKLLPIRKAKSTIGNP
jgi:hypothetical protein